MKETSPSFEKRLCIVGQKLFARLLLLQYTDPKQHSNWLPYCYFILHLQSSETWLKRAT